jgi:Fe-S cluster biosynthesis and repair protein YggX
MYNNVTAVLTSCGRLDLLERTIKSLDQEFWDLIPVKILTEDSANAEIFKKVKQENENGYLKNWTILYNEKKLGQSASIDRAYSLVKTDYVFHLEDDWEFYNDKFIDRSLAILEKYENIVQVTFRPNSPHIIGDELYEEKTDCEFGIFIPGYNGWPGFTYNPNIFKYEYYEKIKPIAGRQEKEVGLIFNDLEMYTAKLINGSVDHIGDGRHVPLDQTLW